MMNIFCIFLSQISAGWKNADEFELAINAVSSYTVDITTSVNSLCVGHECNVNL